MDTYCIAFNIHKYWNVWQKKNTSASMSPRIKWAELLNLLLLREKHLCRLHHPDTSICTQRGLESVPGSDNLALGPATCFIHKSSCTLDDSSRLTAIHSYGLLSSALAPSHWRSARFGWSEDVFKKKKRKKAALIHRSCDTMMLCVFVTYCYVPIKALWINLHAKLCIWAPVCWKPMGLLSWYISLFFF